MEFKLQKDPQDEAGAEKTQILDTQGQQALALGNGPPSAVEELSHGSTPWVQGFSRIDLQDSLVHKHIPQTAAHAFKNIRIPGMRLIGLLLLFVVLAGGGGFVLWDYFMNGVDPMSHTDSLLSLIPGFSDENSEMQQSQATEPRNRPGLEPATNMTTGDLGGAPPTTATGKVGKEAKIEGLNPYWGLSNDLASNALPVLRKITPEEEVSWANALKHKYPYQRYRAILEIRQSRLAGSESLLWFALYDEKLWIRMRALMTLADLGIKVGLGHVKLAIGHEPDMRVANFFKRFTKNASPGDLYVMRHAIRLLSEQGRLVILKALEHNRDEFRDMYMAAASLDKGPHVKQWLKQNYIIFDMNGANYQKYIAAITGSVAVSKDILKSPRVDGMMRQNPALLEPSAVPAAGPVTIPDSANQLAQPASVIAPEAQATPRTESSPVANEKEEVPPESGEEASPVDPGEINHQEGVSDF